jgi:hypothetical protein
MGARESHEEIAMTEATGDESAASSATRRSRSAPARKGAGAGEHPKTGRAMTPAAALSRHVDWLEFALAAARSEETWRAARLDKATKKNREKRMARIAEVREEIEELAALLEAIRGLRARGARRTTATTTRKRATGATTTTRRRRAPAATGPA